jgi:hypothetical protein
MGYNSYQGYGPRADIANLLMQQQAAQANGLPGAPGAGAPYPNQSQPAPAGGGVPEVAQIPGLAEADQSARSQREIAEMLTGRAMGRNATSIGTGLAQLGEAFIARKSMNKANDADSEAARMRSEMVAKAMGGDMSALGQIDLGAAIGQQNSNQAFAHQTAREGVEDQRYIEQRDNTIARQGIADTQYDNTVEREIARALVGDQQFSDKLGLDRSQHEAEMKLGYAGLTSKEDIEALKAAGEVPNNPAGLDKDAIKLEREFAKDWKTVYNDYADIQQQMGRIRVMGDPAIPDNERAAADLALVVAFTKMLDPGSVAREGEVALTQSAASLMGQVGTWLPKLQKGKTLLPDETRNALVAAAESMMPLYDGAYDNLGQNYSSSATEYGFEPRRVMMGYQPPGERGAQGAAAPVGAPPPEAMAMLMQDMSPEAQREFDEQFGPGSAKKAIQSMFAGGQ